MENYKGFEITFLPTELSRLAGYDDSILPIQVYNKELNLGSVLHIEGSRDLPKEELEKIIRIIIDDALEKPERWKLK